MSDKKNTKTIYLVIESCAGYECSTDASGGYPIFCKTETEAKEVIASMAEEHELERGENDGEKYVERRWDNDDTLAWIDSDGYFWKAELYTHEIEV